MNELIAEMSSDPINELSFEENCSGIKSLKRNSDFGQTVQKRLRDEDMDDEQVVSQTLTYNSNDRPLYGDEEEEEPYREYTEEERNIMDISNQLINFNLNFVSLEWDEYYVDRSVESPEKEVKPINKEVEFPLKTSVVIHGYFLETMISSNKRTAVYIGYKAKSPEMKLIIKIGFEMGFRNLENEFSIYKKLKTSKCVPRLVDHIWWKTYINDFTTIRWGLLVMEKCGPNLVDIMKMSVLGMIGPIEQILNGIAISMINAIESLHESGFIHLSLKPEHFILETEDLNQFKVDLKLIGLSSSKTYLKSINGTKVHIEDQKDRKLPKGDPNFHSIGYHNGYRRSRRDDMESLGYSMVYLIRKTLPWMDSSRKDLTSSKVIRKIGNKMQNTSIAELCEGLSPEFYRYFDLISKYEFSVKPDYEELRKCFGVSPQ